MLRCSGMIGACHYQTRIPGAKFSSSACPTPDSTNFFVDPGAPVDVALTLSCACMAKSLHQEIHLLAHFTLLLSLVLSFSELLWKQLPEAFLTISIVPTLSWFWIVWFMIPLTPTIPRHIRRFSPKARCQEQWTQQSHAHCFH